MNAINLVEPIYDSVKTDVILGAKKTNIWLCGKCRRNTVTKDYAEKCCQPNLCQRCQKECPQYHTFCSPCQDLNRFEKAVEVLDYQGWVYSESHSRHNNGFYESMEEFLDYVDEYDPDDESFNAVPEFVYACHEIPFPSFEASDLVEPYCAQYEEPLEAYDRVEGLELMQKALNWFTKKNAHNITYEPDYKRIVRVK